MTKQATKGKPAATPGGVHVYLDWARERLDEVEATLTSHGKTAGKLQGEARAKADRALVDMRVRGDSFRKAIAREGEGGEAAWGKAKALLETDWKAFEASVQEYVDAAGQQVEQQKAAFKARADAQLKAWRQAADKMNTGAAGFAAARRADVDAAVKRMTAEATAAQAKLDKVGSESWSVMRTARSLRPGQQGGARRVQTPDLSLRADGSPLSALTPARRDRNIGGVRRAATRPALRCLVAIPSAASLTKRARRTPSCSPRGPDPCCRLASRQGAAR